MCKDGDMPEIQRIKYEAGVAGQYAYRVTLAYPDEAPSMVRLVGSAFGGPVVLVTEYGQTFVDSAVTERCGGVLTPDYVRKFFGEDSDE